MAFTGKCTYSGQGVELAEDVSDLVSILSAYETPLLDILGDAPRPATSTRHEWMEDSLLINYATIEHNGLDDSARTVETFGVGNPNVFRVGDLIKQDEKREIMMVTAIDTVGHTLTVTRGYGGTQRVSLENYTLLLIIGNAALEGQEAGPARYTTRSRVSNFTQIFSAPIQVSGTELAVRQLAVADELDYQKTLRLRELLRDLENTVINGVQHESYPAGTAQIRRTMNGLLSSIKSNVLSTGHPDLPEGSELTEERLNAALRVLWQGSGSKVDLIVCGGAQKRKINNFIAATQRFPASNELYKNMVSAYESDFGVCRIVLSRYVPSDVVLLLDSSRISIIPLAGRSFHYKPLASTGDYVSGEIVGEYTLEVRNEGGHGYLKNLAI